MPGSPMDQMLPLDVVMTGGDAIEVHVDKANLDDLLGRGPQTSLASPQRTCIISYFLNLYNL